MDTQNENKIEKKLLNALTVQAHHYDELVTVVDRILDGYFDEIDELMVCPDSITLKVLIGQLSESRENLAAVFETAQQLHSITQHQITKLQGLIKQVS